jgi:hypothetical protein
MPAFFAADDLIIVVGLIEPEIVRATMGAREFNTHVTKSIEYAVVSKSLGEVKDCYAGVILGTHSCVGPSGRMPNLSETYLTRAKECRRLASKANDPILIDYLTELAEALEQEAKPISLETLHQITVHG